MKRDKLHFTIVELLVVIGIIAILASMLLPSLKKAKEKAHEIACVNNMKQFGYVFRTYADDYNECMPIHYDPSGWCSYYSYWYNLIPSYFGKTLENLDESKTFQCPSDKGLFGHSDYWPYWKAFASYGINQYLAANNRFMMKKWEKPSRFIVLCEAKDRDIYNNSFFVNPSGSSIDACLDYMRHNKRANYLMGDFHVESIKEIKATSGGWIYGADYYLWCPF